MINQRPCNEPGCKQGKIVLFTSIKNCNICNGTGFVFVEIKEEEEKSKEDKEQNDNSTNFFC
jgi:hypothetical protein